MIKKRNDHWYKTYRAKSVKELDALITKNDKFIQDFPQFAHSWANEFGELLRAFRAEKIGK